MLILRNILITILLIMLAAISVVGLMVEAPPVWNWTPDRINELGRSVLRVMRPGMLLFIVWWLLLLGTLLVFFISVARPRRRMKIEVQMGGGKVVIMDAAIKKYVRSALSEIDDVNVKKIDLREQRGQITTDIYADVRTKENLPVLERRIISRVRTALAEDLGITNLGDVHVYIKNFEVTGRPITPAPAPAEQPEESVHASAVTSDDVRGSRINDDTTDFGRSDAATVETTSEPVLGGETASDAEHHVNPVTGASDEPDSVQPLVLPTDESAASWSDRGAATGGAVTETSDSEEVILAEKPLPAQDEPFGGTAPGSLNPAEHEDLDDHGPVDSKEDRLTDDDNRGSGRIL